MEGQEKKKQRRECRDMHIKVFFLFLPVLFSFCFLWVFLGGVVWGGGGTFSLLLLLRQNHDALHDYRITFCRLTDVNIGKLCTNIFFQLIEMILCRDIRLLKCSSKRA